MASKRTPAAQKKIVLAAPAVPSRAATPSPGNVALELKAAADGSGEVVLAYEGPLAAHGEVLARAGTSRRGAAPWSEIQDVRLSREAPGRWVGALRVGAGAPVEAVQLAFHADADWDNGGRAPLGYYEWSVRERQVVVR